MELTFSNGFNYSGSIQFAHQEGACGAYLFPSVSLIDIGFPLCANGGSACASACGCLEVYGPNDVIDAGAVPAPDCGNEAHDANGG